MNETGRRRPSCKFEGSFPFLACLAHQLYWPANCQQFHGSKLQLRGRSGNTIQEAGSPRLNTLQKRRASGDGSARVRRKMSSPPFLWSKMYAIPSHVCRGKSVYAPKRLCSGCAKLDEKDCLVHLSSAGKKTQFLPDIHATCGEALLSLPVLSCLGSPPLFTRRPTDRETD